MNNTRKIYQQIVRDQYMLNQFAANLQTTIDRLCSEQKTKSETLTALRDTLNGDPTWAQVNQVELALVDYYDDSTLKTEWQRRLAETSSLPNNIAQFYTNQTEPADLSDMRTLMSRLVIDLQWVRESRRVIRMNESRMRTNIVWLFLASFVLFFTPTIFRIIFDIEFDNHRLYYLFTAATSGILGAAFSQLTTIQSRVQGASLDQVKSMSRIGYILARAMVGAGAGLIMFYLMQSGLLSGAFFPGFIQSTAELQEVLVANGLEPATEAASASLNIALTTDSTGVFQSIDSSGVSQKIESTFDVGTLSRPPQGLSLLIIWCLLAGFAEKLIPGILNNKARKALDSSTQ